MRTSEPEVSETGQQRLPFWLSAASYWLPEHIVTSAWLTHAPFAFWLVDVLRPRSIVELGTHHGPNRPALACLDRNGGGDCVYIHVFNANDDADPLFV